jgi:glycosyltransferase involved in cell wall biosynthesis
VVTTSEWTRGSLLGRYPLDPARVHVATPGTDAVPVAPGTPDGGRLLCVAAVAPHKGHDVLVDALAGVEGPWRCTVVGSPDRDPPFAARLERRAVAAGIAERIRYTGPRVDEDLLREHGGADLLVVPSRGETYGMVVAEALAAGLPVLATGVGGVPEALGRTAAGRPGMLVPPGVPGALAAALTRWLTDPGLRCRLRHAARARRPSLPSWQATIDRVGEVLTAVLGEPDPLSLRVPR